MSNKLDLDAIMKLAAEATEGPWEACVLQCEGATDSPAWRSDVRPAIQLQRYENAPWNAPPAPHPDAAFIAAARTAVPALVERVRKLEAERDEAREALEDMCGQFAFTSTQDGAPALVTGGLSALEGAFAVLGWGDIHPIPFDKCEEPECSRRATCGTPTPSGYRRLCGEHFRAALEKQP